MEHEKIIYEVAAELGIAVKENDYAFAKQQLINKINDLVAKDFHRLISIFYRLDINETKLKQQLADHPETDAGILIADLIIERQLQKIKSRKESKKDENINDEERW